MLVVKVNNSKDIERSLKLMKSKVRNTKLINELNNRKEYKKPSVIKREIIKKAIYKNKIDLK